MKKEKIIKTSCSENDFATRIQTRLYTNITLLDSDILWDEWKVTEKGKITHVRVYRDYTSDRKISKRNIFSFIINIFKKK